ncbi:unnamed protein product [Urochloa humidicola]
MVIFVHRGPEEDKPATTRSKPAVKPPAERRGGPPLPGPAQEAAADRLATTTDRQPKKCPEPVQAAKKPSDSGSAAASSSSPAPEYQEAAAAAAPCKNLTRDGNAKELRVEGAKKCDLEPKKRLQATAAPDPGELDSRIRLQATAVDAASPSGKKSVEEDPAPAACAPSDNQRTKKGEEETRVRTSEASWVWNFFRRPWLQQRRLEGPDFLRKKTSPISRLFECCGLVDVIVSQDFKVSPEDFKDLHVKDKRTISQAKCYFNITTSVADKLSELYSSFRVVLGDGECFYRSFIYSYLELVLENDDYSEEDRLLSAIEEVSSGCMGLEWLYDDFYKPCTAFRELVQKVKSWKTETRAVRRTLLLAYFGDYKETEDILTFLRVTSASWILTHQAEFSAFYVVEDGMTLEQHCRAKIIKSRSYADHLAITALSHALGIPIRIFCLRTGTIQDMNHSVESTSIPTVSLAYTGIHYDILYPN